MRPLALLVLVVIAGTACSDPTEAARSISIRNDIAQLVVLGDHLNDRIAPGDQTTENVSVDLNPYRFHVLDTHGRALGCLDVRTHPLPKRPVLVSTMTPCAQ